jgi:hypothetical protein
MDENGNLQDRIGIQMGQVKMVEIKEAAKKGRNGKTEAAEKERSVNHGLMSILSRDSDPWQIRQEQSSFGGRTPMDTRWRSSGSEMTDMWLPAKGNWLLGSIGGITAVDELEAFLLGAISVLPASRVEGELQRGFGSEKARTRARKAEAAKSAALIGYSRARYRLKKCPVSTRRLFPKHRRATSSPDSYFQNTGAPHHHLAIILKVPHAARYRSALPLKR